MTVAFSPFLPWLVLAGLAAVAVILSALGFWRGVRGASLRALALAALLLALANPLLTREAREQLSTVVPIVVDRSQSQETGDRRTQTDRALAGLEERFSRFPRIETRIVEVDDDGASETPSTRLFSALSATISDVPPGRIG